MSERAHQVGPTSWRVIDDHQHRLGATPFGAANPPPPRTAAIARRRHRAARPERGWAPSGRGRADARTSARRPLPGRPERRPAAESARRLSSASARPENGRPVVPPQAPSPRHSDTGFGRCLRGRFASQARQPDARRTGHQDTRPPWPSDGRLDERSNRAPAPVPGRESGAAEWRCRSGPSFRLRYPAHDATHSAMTLATAYRTHTNGELRLEHAGTRGDSVWLGQSPPRPGPADLHRPARPPRPDAGRHRRRGLTGGARDRQRRAQRVRPASQGQGHEAPARHRERQAGDRRHRGPRD